MAELNLDNPYKKIVSSACSKATEKYILGHMSFDEAIDFAVNYCEQLTDTEEFKQGFKDYINNFVNVKDIREI